MNILEASKILEEDESFLVKPFNYDIQAARVIVFKLDPVNSTTHRLSKDVPKEMIDDAKFNLKIMENLLQEVRKMKDSYDR